MGGPRARVWLPLAGCAVLIAAAIPFATRPTSPTAPTTPTMPTLALTSLSPGSCFRLPSKDYRRTHPEDPDGLLREVVPAPCRDPHLGEVLAQAAIDPARIPFSDVPQAANVACREPFADYNPDFWALPPNVGITLLPPRDGDLRAHPVVTCLYIAQNILITGGLHPDLSRLTTRQRRYLDAVRAYDSVSADSMDIRESVPSDELGAWAKELADAEQHMVDALQQLGAPPGAEQQFAVVLDQHRKAVAAWQAAAADPAEFYPNMTIARAAEHASMDPDQAVRAALGLATTMRPRGYSL